VVDKNPPGRIPASGDGRAAHLRDYWKIVRRGRWTVVTIFALTVGLMLLKVTLATPIYTATATLEVKPEARRILPGQEQGLGAEGGGWIGEEKYFNTQLEVLKSRDVAEATFRRLHLERHPLFEASSDPVGRFAGMIAVRPKTETRLVSVSMSGPNPKEVKEWVNALADVYVKRNVQKAVESFNGIMDEISRGLESFRGSLEQADTRRLQIAAEEELYSPENQEEILRRRLETFNDQLSSARLEIGSLEAELEGLKRVRREGGDLLTLPRCAQDPVVQDLTAQRLEAEKELRRIAIEKKPRHPEYLAKLADVEKINGNLDEQIEKVVDKLQSQHRLKVAEATFLHEQIRKTEDEAFRVQQASSSYEISKNDAEAKRKVYDVVAETMERLSVGAQLISMNNNLSILDYAIEPKKPVRPRKGLSLIFGGALGLLLGLASVLFMDYLDNTVRSPEDIEEHLGLSILAIVPKRKDSNAHAVREAFQSLRTSILFSSHNREKRILLISSAGPQEGKSNTASSLAKTFASAGDKVVVIDCDLRRPTQHVHMNVGREPGLTNYLLDGRVENLASYLKDTEIETLKILPCGPIPPNPPELLGLAKFRELLLEFKRTHDWVIIDSPPVMNLADTLLLASMAEIVAIVIKHNENDRDLILRSVKQLRDIDANIIGAVLNNLDVGKGQGDYYYAGYYYYGEGTGGDGKKSRRSRSKADSDSRRPGERVAL
jgi:capsular exopolysaccharide synthesis family protein